MDHKFQSLVDALSDYAPRKDADLFIEGRAQQVIASVGNLRRLINETYDSAIAEDLIKRLMNAIRGDDDEKFRRGIRKIREARRSGRVI